MLWTLYSYNILCIVSNEVPEHPCVSPSSNCVFERRLIEKYIAENGTDPISGEPVSEEQLIDIKGRIIINWHIPFKQNCLIKTWKQILLWLGSSYHSVTSRLHLLFPYWMHLFLSLDTIMLFFSCTFVYHRQHSLRVPLIWRD